MSEHAYKMSICSTNNSSSDEEDLRSLKFASDFSPLSSLSRRPRSFSANRSQVEDVGSPTVGAKFTSNSKRRASISLDNHSPPPHCKTMPPSKLLELVLEDKAREQMLGNRFLDDIALLTKSYKDSLSRSEVESEVIPEEIEGREDLDLNPVPIIKDKLEEAIVPTHRNIQNVHEPIKEEEEDQEYIKIRHEEITGVVEDRVEEAILPISRGTSELHEPIKEEGEEEQDNIIIRHSEISRFLEKDRLEEAIMPLYRGTSELHEPIKEEGEEEQDNVTIRHAELNRFLEKDKVEEAYLSNSRSILEVHETINEEYEDEERVVVRLDEVNRCIDRADAPNSPKSNIISGVPESITEEEEEENEVQLKHDEFWDKIVSKDAFYFASEDHRSGHLQEVIEDMREMKD
jgi:hypothetical protein